MGNECVPVREHVCVFTSGRIPSITHGLGPQAETRSHVEDGGRRRAAFPVCVSVLHIHVSVLRLGERERGGVRKGEGEVFMLGNERAYSGRGSAGEAKSSTH